MKNLLKGFVIYATTILGVLTFNSIDRLLFDEELYHSASDGLYFTLLSLFMIGVFTILVKVSKIKKTIKF